jgi:hypothetical protein
MSIGRLPVEACDSKLKAVTAAFWEAMLTIGGAANPFFGAKGCV